MNNETTEHSCVSQTWERDPGTELKVNLTRRNMLKAAAVGLAAIGLSIPAEAAMAASSQVKAGKASSVPLKSGRSFTLKGQYIIVTQPKKGVYKAFSGICTHQPQYITGISGTNLVCRAHGAYFDTTTGNPTGGPGRSALTHYKVTKKSGVLYITL
jgi:nitrite reductase/ring-hydroxylating ferredoxin subunit